MIGYFPGDISIAALAIAEPVALVIIAFGLLQNAIYVSQLAIAYSVLRNAVPEPDADRLWSTISDVAPPVALLAPAYNESAGIVESIRSLLAIQYPSYEVIVINDGSSDDTLNVVIKAFSLASVERAYEQEIAHKAIRGLYASPEYPNLLLVDKVNGGKADALNAGVTMMRSPLFCAIDADSLIEADALLRVVQPFVDDPDRTIAVGGTIRIANGCTVHRGRVVKVGLPKEFLPLLQTVEYLRAFLMARLAWGRLEALTLISGAFGIFRRSAAIAVGGYSHGTVGEDLEIVMKMHRHFLEAGKDYAIQFIPEPVCWTEAPSTLRVLGRQRSRWQRGALETFFKHRDMIFRPRYGRIGSLGYLNMLIVDVLGPPLEVLGYLLIPLFWAIGILEFEYFIAFLAVTFTFGVSISVFSLILEEMELRRFASARDLMVLMAAAVLENFGYRQLNNVWRIRGWWQYLRGSKGWGAMPRAGFRNPR